MRDYSRIEIIVDVFEQTDQVARPLAHLPVAEFITAILEEFQEIDYLSMQSAQYQLINTANAEPLSKELPIGEQVPNGARVTLVEHHAALPSNAQAVSKDAYLREVGSHAVYKLQWSPAIIGRTDTHISGEELLLVDLADATHGLRVSRRHVQITENAGVFYVKRLSRNPAHLIDAANQSIELDLAAHPLQHGDVIQLKRSGIAFKFIERTQVGSTT